MDANATCIAPEIPRRLFEEATPAILARHGFLTAAELGYLAGFDRLRQVLVRCGNGRFRCPAQDARHFMRCVEAGGDYVRDVCLPADDSIFAGKHVR